MVHTRFASSGQFSTGRRFQPLTPPFMITRPISFFPPRARATLAAIGAIFAAHALHAQAVKPAEPASAAKPAETIILNPFEVQAEADNSYGALNSNSITRFNTKLNEVPVSADIFTEDFMRDVATASVEELLAAYGTAGGISSSAPDSDASSNQPGDRIGNFQLGARGLTAGTVRRDGFVAVGSIANPGSTAVGQTSTFDTERVETIRGPQGLLYGASGAGATVNTVSKQARFDRRSGSLMYRVDQYGSKLGQLDYNYGLHDVALRVSLMDQHQVYRRVLIGGETRGIYAQFAYRLPKLRSTLRVEGQKTWSDRINSSNPRLNVSSTNNDPRHNYFFTYLLAKDLAGAVNPATGAAYPVGAVNRGGLTWDNVNSWSGWENSEWVINQIYSAKVQTQWTPWLSSEVAGLYNVYDSDRMNGGQTTDAAPGFQSNPTGNWASAYTPQDNEQPSRHRAVRASLLATNHLFRDRAKSQTLLGFDADYAGQGPTNYIWVQADSNWVPTNTGGASNLGRTTIPQQWWVVGSSPVKNGVFKPGWASPRVTLNGINYVRVAQNPRNPAWVTPLNPLGLASGQFTGTGSLGSNNKGFVQESNVTGFYGTNYTTWLDGRLGTMVGIRQNQTQKRNPNTGSLPSFIDNKKSNQSYNLGVNYELRSWLRAYYSLSNTYNTPIANANDPLGNLPKTSSGTGQEVGLKFESERAALSGSVQYFWTNSKDEMINAGTGVRDLINPTGLNGSEPGPGGGKNQWINLDRTTRGAETMITASPTRNWRIRFSASVSDGTNLTDKIYPLLYNDQFYLANNTVTFKDGTPFLVPTDAATITAQVNRRTAQIDPATIQNLGTWAPLTLAMINDPTNPYYANPDNGNGHVTGTNLSNALKFFISPARGSALTGVTGEPLSKMQYNWSDPNHTNGQTIVARKGEATVGYAQYTLNLTQFYTFNSDNWMKGIGLGGSVSTGFKYRTYFYNSPDGSRNLYSAPTITTVNGIFSYQRKFKRVGWQTQVNINNLFNHYKVDILPNNGSGFTNPQNLQATFYGQPRTWMWTNTFSF
jgi:outer membrane receptor for ferric coprogen and ferric-rhodotorulic acid